MSPPAKAAVEDEALMLSLSKHEGTYPTGISDS